MKAWCLIRDQPWYRREAFLTGLQAAGAELEIGVPRGAPGDVLLIWNRYGHHHQVAASFEAAGGLVLVAENGYIGRGGVSPKFEVHPRGPADDSYYALAIGYHNGCGRWPDRRGDRWLNETETYGARWRALGLTPEEWRTSGEHVLVCPNRSFGVGAQVMPADWAARTVARLKKSTRRPVRLRAHPGNDAPAVQLARDLENCWAVVVWSSSCGVHALVEGIPVVCEAPGWILKGACPGTLDQIDQRVVGERMPHFERLGWAQWTVNEIRSGEPFRALIEEAARGHGVSPARQTEIATHP